MKIGYYQLYVRYRGEETIYSDYLTTGANMKEVEEDAKHSLAGGPHDDGSLPEFVKAKRISKAEAQQVWNQNPIDWINHDEMRNALD